MHQPVEDFDIILMLNSVSISRCIDGGHDQVTYRRALLTTISLFDVCASTQIYESRPSQRFIQGFVNKLDQWEREIPMSMDYHSIKLKDFICFLRTKYKPMVFDTNQRKIAKTKKIQREIRDIFKRTSTKK